MEKKERSGLTRNRNLIGEYHLRRAEKDRMARVGATAKHQVEKARRWHTCPGVLVTNEARGSRNRPSLWRVSLVIDHLSHNRVQSKANQPRATHAGYSCS